jgi:hypothetical protein
MSLKDLDAKYGWLGKYVNALIAGVVFLVVIALTKYFVTITKHQEDLAPLQQLPAAINDALRDSDSLRARVTVLEDFRLEQRVQGERITGALQDLSRQMSVNTAMQATAEQRLKRIEDKLDRQ